MDDDQSFANILAQSSAPSKPTWGASSPADDPWANPFAESSSSASNPFADISSPFGASSTYITPSSPPTFRAPESPKEEISPYVRQLEEDDRVGRGTLPDPPSVIAAREQEAAAFSTPYGSAGYAAEDDYRSTPVVTPPVSPPKPSAPPSSRKLPSGLIDEDLMAASDPSLSLKKAFVKSTPASSSATGARSAQVTPEKPKAYVFTPGRKGSDPAAAGGSKKDKGSAAMSPPPPVTSGGKPKENGGAEHKASNGDFAAPSAPAVQAAAKKPPLPPPRKDLAPTSIPLPESRSETPIPPFSSTMPTLFGDEGSNTPFSPPTTVQTPMDRVAVSPLDAPSASSEYGFKNLSIGGSSAPPVPSKEADGWGSGSPSASAKVISPPGSRFSGKGWGAVDGDDEDDGGLFGKGGPSLPPVRTADPWGGGGGLNVGGSGAWGGEEPSSFASSSALEAPTEEVRATEEDEEQSALPSEAVPNGTHKRVIPVFHISVGDPTKVGDPVRGYTVYTVRTRTTSPHYRKSEFSVLRRFSDFLWLFEALTSNNPGIIVPPVPDKKPIGRFQDQFIETRRAALQKCLGKISSHPVLQLDPDLRLFLESDNFTYESKNRRAPDPVEKQGLLAGWTGPKYIEQDDWFESRKAFLDSLESQLKGLAKSVEGASKSRLEMAVAMGDFGETVSALAESDLGSAMCAALARLAELARKEKEANEELAKGDVIHLLNMADEYVRFISSVRLAFAGRVKAYHTWQNGEKEVVRLRSTREKLRAQGKLGDRVQSSLAEVVEAERRARDASTEFETVSRLVKSEFARFERERVEEFKQVLENHLAQQIEAQRELIKAWEEYHGIVLRMVQRSQPGVAGAPASDVA